MDLSGGSPKVDRSEIIENALTSIYLQIVLFYISYLKGLYNAKYEDYKLIVLIILAAEVCKYCIFKRNHIRHLKFKSSAAIIKDSLKLTVYFCVMVAVYHVTAILFGAPFLNDWEKTLLFSVNLSALTVLPLCLQNGTDINRLLDVFELDNEKLSFINVRLTVLGAWLGAFVIPLDWDRPWQIWPIPCIIGTIVGSVVGHLATLYVQVRKSSKKIFKSHYRR